MHWLEEHVRKKNNNKNKKSVPVLIGGRETTFCLFLFLRYLYTIFVKIVGSLKTRAFVDHDYRPILCGIFFFRTNSVYVPTRKNGWKIIWNTLGVDKYFFRIV